MKMNISWLDKVFSGTVFKILYIALALLSFNAFVYYQPFFKYVVWFVTAFGILNCIYRLINVKHYIKTPYLILLSLFIASFLLTMILNIKYGFMESLQGLIWMVFQLALLYVCDIDKPYAELKREFKKVGLFFIWYITLACAVSLAMVIMNYGQILVLNKIKVIPRGFVWGRLWGVFTDPNYASASVCISIMLSLFFLNKSSKRYLSAFYILSLALSFLYIVFSDSRTGYVTLLCSLLVWCYLRFYTSKKLSEGKERKIWHRRVIAASLSLIVILTTFGAMNVTKIGYNAVSNLLAKDSPNQEQQIERSYTNEVDITNRRFDLWISGIEIFETSPVAGVGFRNLQAAARDKVPDTYLINNSLGEFDAFHNMWIDLLASQGIIGIAIFMAFTLCCAISILRLLHNLIINRSDEVFFISTLFCAVLVSVVSSLFISDTVYVNTPNAVMFWTLLGYLMRFVYDKKTSDKLLNAQFSPQEEGKI